MKKKLFGLLVIVLSLICMTSISAADTDDALWAYEPYGDGVVLTEYKGSATDVYVPSNIEVGGEKLDVVKLGDGIFENNDSLNSVTLGAGVTEIGAKAFYDADNMVCILLAEDTTTIGAEAFYSCDSFNSVILYDAVNTIGKMAFAECASLTVWCNKGNTGYTYAVTNGIAYELISDEAEPSVLIQDGIEYYLYNGIAVATDYVGTTTEITVPAIVGGYPVTELRETFNRCSKITSVVLPDGLRKIGENTFYMCTALKEVNIPSSVNWIGVWAFYDCRSLKSIILPQNITYVCDYTFQGCSSLVEVAIPDKVRFVGNHAFSSCDALEKISLSSKVLGFGKGAFYGCKKLSVLNIPDSVETIAAQAFLNCTALHQVFVPDSVTSMEIDSFSSSTLILLNDNSYAHSFAVENGLLHYIYDGENLPKTVIQDGVRYIVIDEEAIAVGYDQSSKNVSIPAVVQDYKVTELRGTFNGFSGLLSVTLPEGLKMIGADTFLNCLALESIVIPDSVTVIGNNAFRSCIRLKSVNIPDGVLYIGERAFNDCAIIQLIIPETVEHIGDVAFSSCSYLKEVTLPKSLKEISYFMFFGCKSLKNIEIPEGVSRIDNYAFDDCESLESIIIPSTVTEMYANSFTTTAVILIKDNEYALEFAKENNFIYYVYDGTSTPEVATSNGIKFVIMGEKAIAINCTSTASNITVPSEINGIPVTELRRTFYGCKKLTTVSLPDTLIHIGDDAFFGCSKLRQITIPDSVIDIGVNAFGYCGFTDITIPNSVIEIGVAAFRNCSSLETVKMSEKLEQICVNAFSGCSSLSGIVIPKSVKTIGSWAFGGCSSLATAIFYDSLEFISSGAFRSCNALKQVIIPRDFNEPIEGVFPTSTILIVYEGSSAHNEAKKSGLLYFVLPLTANPEISYGTGITGTVTYTDGSAASGATVEILYDDGTVKEEVTTDANGAYAFTYAEVGQYTIRATDEKGNTSTTTASVKRMNVFDVFVSGDTDLTLKQGWTVSGTVSENVATVTITDEDGNVIDTVETTDGAFAFGNIPNGTYVVTATSESGSISQEITVYNANVSGINLTLPTSAEAATIWGYVEVEDRDKKHNRRNWVEVTVYNTEGIAVGQTKTDADGKYTFANLPLGEYTIVAETAEMRPDKKHGFDRSHTLTGYAYVNATEATTYQVETIVLYEENDSVATIAGKVTAEGETQDCEVILRNVFRHEIAKQTTGKNGKYSFVNVRDGLYFIIATTNSDGMGMAVVVVRDGKVYGETDIKVSKKDFIREQESKFIAEITCNNRDEALLHRERIADEKRFYDSLSEKEKKQLSKDYIERLEQYVAWLAEVDYTAPEGVIVEQGGLVVSGDEIEKEETVSFNLTVEKQEEYVPSTDCVKNEKDHKHHKMKDTAGNKEIKEYYEIKMSKNTDDGEKEITSVTKDTDANGKFRITMEIPEEYRGYKNYTMLHEHHGEVVTLVDLDDDPNTITFEVDKFSTFALAVSNEETVGDTSDEVTPSEPVCDINGDGKMNVADVLAVAKAVLNKQTSTIYDTNKDGRISLVDVLCIMKLIVA